MAWTNPFSIAAKVQRAVAEVERRSDQPRWRLDPRFLIKGSLLSAVVAGAVFLLASRYSIAIAPQASLCLPPYRLWLIDKYDTHPAKGEIFAFSARGLEPIFPDGTKVVKVLEGVPGERVVVTPERTLIEGREVAQGLELATQYGIDPQRYVRAGTIAEDRYWFFGRTADSFDSRYWGSVGRDQILGRAYPIW